ncbi:hypothetical protein MKEN_01247800 [Mycena kentingensis (nom. inval.)]|nr:hypothetical protein MKEN_01247800 [Mycena kentingensis (nom. inval.)]
MVLFFRQFGALFWKNCIVLAKHPFLNILRCLILPVAFGVFLAIAKSFFHTPNTLGFGTSVPLRSFRDAFRGSGDLLWVDATDGNSQPSPAAIMARIADGLSDSQRAAVKQVSSTDEFRKLCPENFNGFSECFGAVVFHDIPTNASLPIQYELYFASGLGHVDVVHHDGDEEMRTLPLQWTLDQAIIGLRTQVTPPNPIEWPFTHLTNKEQDRGNRLFYLFAIEQFVVLFFFLAYIGIAYQLPGAYASDRATQVTAYMKAMGLLDSARIFSWHLSYSAAFLPAWIIVALVWKAQVWVHTNAALVLAVHIEFGLVLASWSFVVAAPFGKSPQLAAVACTFGAIVCAIIAMVFNSLGTGGAMLFTLLLPPTYYIWAAYALTGFELNDLTTNALKMDPEKKIVLLLIMLVGIIDIFLWPWIGVLIERRLYDPREPKGSRGCWCWGPKRKGLEIAKDVAVSVRGLGKVFSTSVFSRKADVTAIEDLTLDIPKGGIFVLLGSNGAGKSTALSILGGLTGRTRGKIVFEGGVARPGRGTLGIVPQKNVLIPELSCLQTLRVWRAVKWSKEAEKDEDLEQLLRDCDLSNKIGANADTLSGGQKRKLQLAIGLVGGSKTVLVDEATSGVDPLSRRALWRTLISVREQRTIVFTTHFLDEADLLADHIAILAAPGKLVASGTPVALKRSLGEGYTVQVSLSSDSPETQTGLLRAVQRVAPATRMSLAAAHQPLYHLKAKDPAVVNDVLRLLDAEKEKFGVASYDVLGTSIEDIFLALMKKEDITEKGKEKDEADSDLGAYPPSASKTLNLASGRATSPLRQALTIFHKRCMVLRRSWLSPLIGLAIVLCGAIIPLVLIKTRPRSCTPAAFAEEEDSLTRRYLNIAPFGNQAHAKRQFSYPQGPALLVAPAILGDAMNILGNTSYGYSSFGFEATPVADNATFVSRITNEYENIAAGGLSVDLVTGQALIAYEASPGSYVGKQLLRLTSTILLNLPTIQSSLASGNVSGLANVDPTFFTLNYNTFPVVNAGTLIALKWLVFYGGVMAIFPAFFALYVSKERRSSVQAMQFSNGLHNPAALWLGHLLFDGMSTLIMATVIAAVFGATTEHFHGLGYLWFVMALYGIAGTLFAYCCSLVVKSPLAALATVAGSQFVIFLLYLASYLLILTYAKPSEADSVTNTVHYTLSLISPVVSMTRAALVSVNLFSLLCVGQDANITSSYMGHAGLYGGPILYLILFCIIFFGILVWVDSGSTLRRKFTKRSDAPVTALEVHAKGDVVAEARAAAASDDLLRVLNASKTFGKNKVVDDVTFGVSKNTIFGMLGPNGAGKTTTFNIIRGDVIPESGDALIGGTSVIEHPRRARVSLGVCPQFSAIDAQLSVRETLHVYGSLKGLRGADLETSIDSLLSAIGLEVYADRLASKLSGGNQRKLSLAAALIGNPPVVLIDEFSTGIDAKKKREMWATLRLVATDKAVIVTTHSMEEAAALSTKVGILAKRMLAVGTTEELEARYATYEVHFSCRNREEVLRAQTLMAGIPGSKMAEDVATRFEVPIGNGLSLAELFQRISAQGEFVDYTVEKGSLESVFLKVIRENNSGFEEDETGRRRGWTRFFR